MGQGRLNKLLEFLEKLRSAQPQFFSHEIELETPLEPHECITRLQAETSPFSDGGKSWDVKPVLGLFNGLSFGLKRHLYTPDLVLLRGRVLRLPAGTQVHLTIEIELRQCVRLLGAILIGIAMPLGVAYSLIGKMMIGTNSAGDTAIGLALGVILPFGSWSLLRIYKNQFISDAKFVTGSVVSVLGAKIVMSDVRWRSIVHPEHSSGRL